MNRTRHARAISCGNMLVSASPCTASLNAVAAAFPRKLFRVMASCRGSRAFRICACHRSRLTATPEFLQNDAPACVYIQHQTLAKRNCCGPLMNILKRLCLGRASLRVCMTSRSRCVRCFSGSPCVQSYAQSSRAPPLDSKHPSS